MSNLREQITSAGYVKVLSNSGVWRFVDFSDIDDNIVVLENTDSGVVGRFPMMVKGKERVIPITNEEVVKGNLNIGNITATVAEDVEMFEDKPIKLTNKKKRRGRPKKSLGNI